MKKSITIEEFRAIVSKFAESGWDLIAQPAKRWLAGTESQEGLLAAVAQAQVECGKCGCTFDPLYAEILQADCF